MNQTKKCKRCEMEKELSEFRNQAAGKYGKKSYCIVCDDEYNAQRYNDKQEHCKNISRKWNEKNPDKVKQYKKKWQNNKDEPDF